MWAEKTRLEYESRHIYTVLVVINSFQFVKAINYGRITYIKAVGFDSHASQSLGLTRLSSSNVRHKEKLVI